MPTTWRSAVNQSVGVARITNISGFVVPRVLSYQSPIDIFYDKTRPVLAVATPTLLQTNDWIGAYLLIGIISETENYFRSVLSKMIRMCFISQKHAAKQSINFGSVIWHPHDEVERGAFEHFSLASADNIILNTKKYIGTEIKQSLNDILEEFDKLCELRHGIVHSGRILAGKNAIKLGIGSTPDPTIININYAQFQEAVAVCTTLIVSYNKLLFSVMAKRWATEWRLTPAWLPAQESEYFKNIWNTFHSTIDKANNSITFSGTWVRCKNQVYREFNP